MSERRPNLHSIRPPEESLVDKVYRELLKAIQEGRLERRSVYSIASLAKGLDVSRPTVREALDRMERRGIVKLLHNRGVEIQEIGVKDLEDIFQIRKWIEPDATKEAVVRKKVDLEALRRELRDMESAVPADGTHSGAQDAFWRHDNAFHDVLLKASGNGPRLANYVGTLRDVILASGFTTPDLRIRRYEDIVAEHKEILDAVEKGVAGGDPKHAWQAMFNHLDHTWQLLLVSPDGVEAAEVGSAT